MKKTTKAIIISIFVISIGANIFYFGNEWFKKEKAKAFNQGIIFTFQKANEIGEVKLKVEDKILILKLQQ